jgi:hypothetical protein
VLWSSLLVELPVVETVDAEISSISGLSFFPDSELEDDVGAVIISEKFVDSQDTHFP